MFSLVLLGLHDGELFLFDPFSVDFGLDHSLLLNGFVEVDALAFVVLLKSQSFRLLRSSLYFFFRLLC